MSFSPQLQPTDLGINPSGSTSLSPLDDMNDTAPVLATTSQQAPQDFTALRSCITCRRRKVRCNKRTPCSNCAKAGVECIFPPPGRAPRKSKRPHDAELLSRLRRLEGVIEHLSEKKGGMVNAKVPDTLTPTSPQQRNDRLPGNEPSQPQSDDDNESGCPLTADPVKLPKQHALEHEFGRLVIDENRSRYVSNRFWASLGDEVEELQDILDPSSSDEDDHPSPGSSSSHSTNHDGFLFGFYSLSHSLRSFHPHPTKIPMLWKIFTENVMPLIPIVYGPTAQQLFTKAAQTPDALDKNNETLVLSMYFAAIVSLSNEQCVSVLGEDRDSAVTRYRFAVEQALSKANLLNTQSLTLLQAAVLFLNAVRRDDDTKFVWSMSSLVLRLAQGLGLHRDGTNFGLKPLDTEMRRRLWWHILLLDLRSSEDHGTDVQIHDRMYDTRLPLNINDSDITPDMQEPPAERDGFTEMTFFLIRCDISVALRRVSYTCPNPTGAASAHHQRYPGKCGNVIQAVNKRVEERYIRHCNMSIPIQWVCATIARLVLTKMWLVIHHPMTRPDLGAEMTNATRESLFVTSVEVAEFARLLSADKNVSRWSWMFATHMQWHAIAFVLSELCVRPLSPLTDRAWVAVSTLYGDWLRTAKQRKGMLWRPLARLMKRAAAFRAKQREELQAQLGYPPPSPQETSLSLNPPQTIMQAPFFAHFPELLTSATATQAGESPYQGTMDFDLSQGPIEVINEFFPAGNWLATPSSHTSSAPQQPTTTGAAISIPNDPPPGMAQDSSNSRLNWEEWDQVMRDFQTDMQEAQAAPIGDITSWVA
ncbi:hypothetical protein ARAM_002476 [Aspergillus rambellii]|uniref:Zn(2)-C6 fungal-type domain-containing protein n=2 Tax=Aspergillus subgen. Nidulantes TaxID=2720870 RepID=A0A0F8X0U4_9EURO|nr:hypothetical protein ARAM_002476 [Aspergillus rambellii]